MVGNNGVIYAHKQADNITALQDDGEALSILWETEIFGSAPFSSTCIGADSSIYVPSFGKILKLDHNTGAKLDSSVIICSDPQLFQLRVSATQNNIIFATNGQNNLYAFTPELDILWTDVIPNVNTSGATISSNGLVVVAGANIIKVYAPFETTAIAKIENNLGVEYYPNPVIDKLNVYFKESNFVGSTYKIIDGIGKIIMSGNFLNKNTTIDLRNFPSGFYLLKIGENDKQTFTFMKE